MFHRTKLSVSILAAFGGALMGTLAQAQQTQKLERVEITGTSIKRIEGESSAPIQIIKREDIERTGATTVEQLMRSVSAIVSSNATVSASASSATTGGLSDISLRGLSSSRTLVLVNGKRTAPYGAPNDSVAVDVDSIPVAAIERIEILKDGASAIYGSDAIAGVVNFILRKDFRGFEITAGYGAATEDNKGDVTKLNFAAGIGDLSTDRFNIMLVGTYQKEGPLFGRDRGFASSAIRLDQNSFLGSSRTEPGNIGIPGVAGLFNPNVDGATQTANCAPRGAYVPAAGPTICLFDTGPFVGLVPKSERMGLMLSGRAAVSEALELYAEAGWNRKEVQTVIQPSPIDAAFGIPFVLTTASPFYPTTFVTGLTGGATPNLNVRYRPFIIGNRDLTDTADALRGVLGAQGAIAGWDYDASLLHTRSQVEETLNGGYFRINDDTSGPGIVPLLSGAVNGTGGTPLWVNPFGDNSAEVTAAARATNYVGQAFKSKTELTSLQGKASKELFQLAGGGFAMAFGADARREGFKLDSAPALSTGNISGYGGNFVSIDSDRSVFGVFAEAIAPVAKGLELGAALRYDRYGATTNPLGAGVAQGSLGALSSAPNGEGLPQPVIDQIAADSTGNASSFGKTTGKASLRYQALPELLLRGTASTGFRAPSLLDLYGPVQAGVSAVQNDPANCQGAFSGDPNFCATQFNTFVGGNSRLKPETSRSFTLGFIAEPVSGISIGVDYFNSEVKNLIDVLSSSFILANEAQFSGRVIRGAPNPGNSPAGDIIAIDQRNENVGKVKLSGIDVDLRGAFATPLGRLALGWTATYMQKWRSQNPDGSYTDNVATTSAAITGVIPRFKHSTNAALTTGGWTFAGQYNWQSGGTDVCGNLLQDDFGNCPPGSNPRFGAYATVDAQIAYNGLKNFGVVLGVRNLFDKDPPYVNGSGGAFQSGYDPTYVDPRGRFMYANLTYKF